jgi:hypothetical protein
MRLNGDALSDLVILREGQPAPTVITTAAASIIEVINTDDSGKGSLRQAILDANASPGADEIRFNIAGAGANNLLNFPSLTAAVLAPDGSEETLITGSLNSEPGGLFLVAFFENETPDSSGFGEGERFLGAILLGTDQQGNAQFSFKVVERLRVGSFISAITFKPFGGDTSEFSKTIAVTDEVADVSVSLNASPSVTPGQKLNLTIALTNNGPKAADGVVVRIDDDSIGFAPIAAGASVTVEKRSALTAEWPTEQSSPSAPRFRVRPSILIRPTTPRPSR